MPPHPPQGLGFEIRYGAGGTAEFPLRLAWQKVTIGEHTLVLGAADPQRKFEGVLTSFTTVLLLSTPVILGLATLCGLWLGRRALAPVARIAADARSITERNLSARLAVPDSGDELQRLSETLNDMLDRIERSFTRTRQFTADASHELRAPMTLIYTAAQYALRRERSREELVNGMQKILRESQRTTALIDDLLLLARGDASVETASLEAIDAAPLLREAGEQATAMAAAKGIRVEPAARDGAAAGPGERGPAAAPAADPGGQRAQVHAVRRTGDDRGQGRRGGRDACPSPTPVPESLRKTCHTFSSASGGPTRCALARPAAAGSA